MALTDTIGAQVLEQARAAGGTFTGALTPDTLLADTGLDSLAFTTLVIELERELGVDPFAGDDDISYPETFGELVHLYAAAGA